MLHNCDQGRCVNEIVQPLNGRFQCFLARNLDKNCFIFISRLKGLGSIAMSLAPARRPSVRPSVNIIVPVRNTFIILHRYVE